MYSAHNPHRVFGATYKDELEVNYTHELQWVLSATVVVQPQFLDNILSAVGIEQLVYLYAKV